MPVPAGGSDVAVLFTQDELALWARGSDVDEATYALTLDLVTTAIRTEAGADRFDALDDLVPLKLVALDVARRMLRNAAGLRSTSRQIDDYVETDTFATETLAAPDLTEDDRSRVWRALGVRTPAAFTIRPSGAADCPAPVWR